MCFIIFLIQILKANRKLKKVQLRFSQVIMAAETNVMQFEDNIDYIFHTHAKFYNVHEDLEETAVALPEVIEAYKKAGYTGFLSSEYEGGEHLRADLDVDSIEQVRRHQAAMKKYIGK